MGKVTEPRRERDDIRFQVEPDEWLPIKKLTAMGHPFNSQVRTERELDAIMASIRDHGFTGEMVVVNRWNQKIVAGHGKIEALLALGYTDDVPVVWVDLPSEADHRRAMLRWNKARGHQDPDKEQAEIFALLSVVAAEDLEHELALDDGALIEGDELPMDETAAARQAESARKHASMGGNRSKIRLVLAVDQIDVVEGAIRATGLMNRADGLVTVCRAFLEGNGGQSIAAGRQSDVDIQAILAAAAADTSD